MGGRRGDQDELRFLSSLPHPPGALAPHQHLSASLCTHLALKVGLEYFNRAIKRMLTYICKETHFWLQSYVHGVLEV